MRVSPLLFFVFILAGCDGARHSPAMALSDLQERAVSARDAVLDGKADAGTAVDRLGEQAAAAATAAAKVLTVTGEVGLATADAAKDALSDVGETATVFTDGAKGALTDLGNAVLSARGTSTAETSATP